MSILSARFLLFTAGLLLFYYLIPRAGRWMVLLAGSLFFAACAGWKGLAHLCLIGAIVWAAGLLLQHGFAGKVRRGILFFSQLFLFGSMVLIKYRSAVIPIGLSYYTFQASGYLADIYLEKARISANPLKAILFIGYFPVLPQGPICSWSELGETLFAGHRFEPENLVSGFTRMLWGYFKKMVIADRLSGTTIYLKDHGQEMPGWMILCGTALFAVRLYADFSGGVDVVTGISRMFGIPLPENFRRPFFSRSVSEYWRRWHISLGKWFRTYVMYPLTVSRSGIALGRRASKIWGKKTGRKVPAALATFLVFVLIGVWHTFSWNALIYGAYFGILLALVLLLEAPLKKRFPRLFRPGGRGMNAWRVIRTWLLIAPAQFFSFTDSPRQGWNLLTGCFRNWRFRGSLQILQGILGTRDWMIVIAALAILLAVDLAEEKKDTDLSVTVTRGPLPVRWLLLIALIVSVLVFGMYGASYDSSAFLYMQF